MENTTSAQPISAVQELPGLQNPFKRIFSFFKSDKKRLFIPIFLIILAIGVAAFISSKKPDKSPSDIIARVGDIPVYQSYLDKEISYYPGTVDTDIEGELKKKIIADELILQAGKKEGIIGDYLSGLSLTEDDYLKRTQDVKKVRDVVEEKAEGIEGEIVSIWFFNNKFIGPLGIEGGKQAVYKKITQLHQKVKNKEITIKQAGDIVATDTSLETIDPEYIGNSHVEFKSAVNKPITFWKGFDDLLWALKPGEITDVYLGSMVKDGKTIEQLYLFGKVNDVKEGSGYRNFDEWFEKQKQLTKITKNINLLGINIAYAATSTASGKCDDICPDWKGKVLTTTGAPVVGATVTQKNCQTIPPDGKKNGKPSGNCTKDGVASRTVTTDSQGKYTFSAADPYNCGHNNFSFTATANIGGVECTGADLRVEKKDIWIDNIVVDVNVPDLKCSPPPPACNVQCDTRNPVCPAPGVNNLNCPACLPASGGTTTCQPCPTGTEFDPVTKTCKPPPPACNVQCDTRNPVCPAPGVNNLNCPACLPSTGGTTTCQPCPTGTEFDPVTKTCKPIPPVCNEICTSDAQCLQGGSNCNKCVLTPNGKRCQPPPPVCNEICTSDAQCLQGGSSCNECVQTANGKRCQLVPKCGDACTRDGQCFGAKEGAKDCSTCVGGVCKPPPKCGDACARDGDCAAARDGCVACVEGVCKPPPACGTACTRDGQCVGAKDGCVSCVSGICKPPPVCGTACTTRADCASAKDGCNECLEGTCTDFNVNMCKCEGSMEADLTFPSDKFTFTAFGVIKGEDVKKAEIRDVTFRITETKKGEREEKARTVRGPDVVKPTIIESSADKVRIKATWSTTPPPMTPGSTFRAFTDITAGCKPKKIIASTENNFTPNPEVLVQLKPPPALKLIADAINSVGGNSNVHIKAFTSKLLSMFGASTVHAQTSNLQLKTLNFVKILGVSCSFVKFGFDETLF